MTCFFLFCFSSIRIPSSASSSSSKHSASLESLLSPERRTGNKRQIISIVEEEEEEEEEEELDEIDVGKDVDLDDIDVITATMRAISRHSSTSSLGEFYTNEKTDINSFEIF
jgi:hypothetical protein